MTDDRRPFVSVVVPTRDRGQLLPGLLASLDQLSYPVDCFEVLVVDDGSQDNTPEILDAWEREGPNRRLLRQDSRGGYAARNAGLLTARGEVVAFTDDDCRVAPDWLERIAETFARNPDVLGVQGRTETTPKLVTPFTHQIVVQRPSHLYETCNMAYRRHSLMSVASPRSRGRYGFWDTELGAAVSSLGAIIFEPRMLVYHPPRPRVFRDLARWRDVLRGEREYYRCHRAHYRQYRGRTFVSGVICHWFLGSTAKQLVQHRRWLVKEPWTYVRFVLLLMRERIGLVAALIQILSSGREGG